MKKGILTTALSVLVLAAMIFGFSFSTDPGTKAPIQPTVQKNNPYIVYGAPLDGPLSTLNESFEATAFPPTGWLLLNPGGGTGWNRQVAGTTPVPGFNGGNITVPTGGGSAVAFCNYITGNSSGGSSGVSDQWLVTPQITNVQANDSLTFWLRKFGSYADNLNVKISTTTPTVAGMTVSVAAISFTAADSGWVQYKYKIGGLVPNGSNIYIGIQEYCANVAVDGASFSLDLVQYTSSTPVTFAWSEQTSGVTTELSSVSAVSDNVCWICGAGGKVLKTINGGTNWTSYTLPATDDAYNIFAYDANTALVTTSPSAGTYVYRTSNGGANWTQVLFVSGGFGDALWMTDANTAYFMGDPIGGNWLLKKSTNGGVNWTDWATVPTTITGGWNNSFFIRGSKVWFGSNTTTVMYSSNSGANWTTQTTPTANQYGIWFNDDNNGMAIYQSLSATTNGGTNWSALTSPVTYYGAGVCGTATKWWATTQNTTPDVYYSSNNGANWTTQYTAPTAGGVFRHLSMARNGNTIWGCRSLGGISKYGTSTGITPIGTVTPVDYTLSQNYPNPFNPTTKINFAIPKSGMVTLKVYNVLGKEVATLVNQNMTAGTYNYEFNASNLSSGIYFYKLDVNGFSQVKKMSLVK